MPSKPEAGRKLTSWVFVLIVIVIEPTDDAVNVKVSSLSSSFRYVSRSTQQYNPLTHVRLGILAALYGAIFVLFTEIFQNCVAFKF